MSNTFSATPTADQPPTITNTRPAAQRYADRWDWLRAAAFFCGAVFLLSLIPTVLNIGYSEILSHNPHLSWDPADRRQTILIWNLVLPAALLIAGSALSDRSFRGTGGRSRLGAVGRLALALGVIAAITGLAVIFSVRIFQALQPLSGRYGILGTTWLGDGIESGLVLGVALAFVFRRLSQRTGRAWLVGLLWAALVAGGILGLYSHPVWLYGVSAPMRYLQAWLVVTALPVVVALLLGALIGAPLAYPYGVGEAHAGERALGAARAAAGIAQGGMNLWRAWGIAAGSFAAGLFATGMRTYAAYQLFGVSGPKTQTLYNILTVVQLAPFGILALIGAIRLMRLPRERRPSAWGIGALALVSVPGLLPILVSQVLLVALLGASLPSGRLELGDVTVAFAASVGALLALCWWPATAFSMRRVLAVALAGWLGFVLSLLLVTGYATYAVFNPSQATCRSLGCGRFELALMWNAIEISLTTLFEGLPLMLVGVWLGSWLLERRGASRAQDAAA